MKIIPLTQGYECLVDDEDFEYLTQWKWRVRIKENPYAVRTYRDEGKDSTIAMHRVIAQRMKLDTGKEVDHRNGNTLDNTRDNLRNCSRQQGQYNRKSFSSNKLGYKGVCRDKNKFRAQIRVDGKKISLGSFATPEEAYEAYKNAAIKYHGEFARLE